MINRKGDKLHRIVGLLFVNSMLLAAFASLILALMHPNYFLFIVGVFSAYLSFSAWRYLRFKQASVQAQWPDYLASVTMLVSALIFFAIGILKVVEGNTFALVLILFAYISIRFVIGDFKFFKSESKTYKAAIAGHLQRMIGAYISAATAFLVVNHAWFPTFIPPAMLWLLPSVIFVPFIFVWSKKYKN